ncbi:hypothetical protein M0805_000201 [Coniferiporia weirii]|nr:hypothetical protein M0805_000201 [Coniferiporia weirii]
MSLPLAEIITFSASETHRADQAAALASVLDALRNTPGQIKTYYGLQVEDPNQGYLVVVWESYEHQRDTYQAALTSALGEFETVHVQLKVDPNLPLSAPVVEFVTIKLREGKTKADISPSLDLLTSQETKAIISSTWGPSIEKDDYLVMVVGWESLEAHQEVGKQSTPEVRNTIGQIVELSEIKIKHAKLSN